MWPYPPDQLRKSHRLQTANEADWVVVLEKGRVIASGPWHQVEASTSRDFNTAREGAG